MNIRNVQRNRLKELREQSGVSMAEMARRLGLEYSQYVHFERCENEISGTILVRMADYFNCPVDAILGRAGFDLPEVKALRKITPGSLRDSADIEYDCEAVTPPKALSKRITLEVRNGRVLAPDDLEFLRGMAEFLAAKRMKSDKD